MFHQLHVSLIGLSLVLLLITPAQPVRDACTNYASVLKKAYGEYDETKYIEKGSAQSSTCLFMVDVVTNLLEHKNSCETTARGHIPFIKENSTMHEMILKAFEVSNTSNHSKGYFIMICEGSEEIGAIQKTRHVNDDVISIYNKNVSNLSLGTLCQFIPKIHSFTSLSTEQTTYNPAPIIEGSNGKQTEVTAIHDKMIVLLVIACLILLMVLGLTCLSWRDGRRIKEERKSKSPKGEENGPNTKTIETSGRDSVNPEITTGIALQSSRNDILRKPNMPVEPSKSNETQTVTETSMQYPTDVKILPVSNLTSNSQTKYTHPSVGWYPRKKAIGKQVGLKNGTSVKNYSSMNPSIPNDKSGMNTSTGGFSGKDISSNTKFSAIQKKASRNSLVTGAKRNNRHCSSLMYSATQITNRNRTLSIQNRDEWIVEAETFQDAVPTLIDVQYNREFPSVLRQTTGTRPCIYDKKRPM